MIFLTFKQERLIHLLEVGSVPGMGSNQAKVLGHIVFGEWGAVMHDSPCGFAIFGNMDGLFMGTPLRITLVALAVLGHPLPE